MCYGYKHQLCCFIPYFSGAQVHMDRFKIPCVITDGSHPSVICEARYYRYVANLDIDHLSLILRQKHGMHSHFSAQAHFFRRPAAGCHPG